MQETGSVPNDGGSGIEYTNAPGTASNSYICLSNYDSNWCTDLYPTRV